MTQPTHDKLLARIEEQELRELVDDYTTTLREQIAREIKERLQKIGYDRNGKEIDEGTNYPEYGDGWCSALDEAAAIARGEK